MAGAASKWWSTKTVAVVTGANKGIGFAIARGLAQNGVTTVLTARDEGRGTKALESLKAEGLNSVVFHPLEVTSPESAQALASWLKSEYGGADILINNAAIAFWERSYSNAKTTIDINYYGVQNVTNALLPVLRPGARIVNVSSKLGQLEFLGSKSLAAKLGDEKQLTEDYVDSYVSKYLEDVKADRWKEEGWAVEYGSYTDSKILLNAYTRAFAKTLSSRPDSQKVYVNLIHPGYIGTDLNNNSGPGTVQEGADTPIWLALLPEKGYPHGKFFFQRKELAW